MLFDQTLMSCLMAWQQASLFPYVQAGNICKWCPAVLVLGICIKQSMGIGKAISVCRDTLGVYLYIHIQYIQYKFGMQGQYGSTVTYIQVYI